MLNLIRARVPSIIIFTTLETSLLGFVAYQWSKPSMITTPLKSAIPQAHLGAVRFHHSHGKGYASAA